MNNLASMSKAIQRILVEEELKDISSRVRNGDTLKITLANGQVYIFEVQGGVGGNIIIKDVDSGEEFTFNSKDFVNDILTVYPYTGGVNNQNGIRYRIQNMIIDISGTTYVIDSVMEDEPEPEPESEVEPETGDEDTGNEEGDGNEEGTGEDEEIITPKKQNELNKSKDDFNSRLLDSEVDDILFINTGIETGDEVFDEHAELEFIVTNKTSNFIQVNLANAHGPKSGHYYNKLNNKQIVINKNSLVVINGTSLELPVLYDDKGESTSFNIVNILSISNNVKHPINQPQKTVKGLSKQSTVDYINQKFPDIWSKQPGLWDTIKGASPTGLYQIGQILNKNKLNNSYLKKGAKLRFIVIAGKEITGVYKNTTLRLDPNHKKGYYGVMHKDKTIQSGGDINKAHWEIELLEEVDDNVYKVKYYFCTRADKCTVKQLGSIKIINIE